MKHESIGGGCMRPVPDAAGSELDELSVGSTGSGSPGSRGSNGASEPVLASMTESSDRSMSLCVTVPGDGGELVLPRPIGLLAAALYCPTGCSIRGQPEPATASRQIATIARRSAERMGCLGRSPQSTFGQAAQRLGLSLGRGRARGRKLTRRALAWAACAFAVSAFCWLGGETLQAQDTKSTDEARPASEAAESSASDALDAGTTVAGSAGLEGQLTLDSGATCMERKRLISRIIRWRETEDVDATLRVQVWGDPKIATRVFFSVSRDGVNPAERTLANAPSDCDELHSAVALSIALAIDSLFASSDRTPLTAAIEALEAKQDEQTETANPPYQRFWEADLLVGATLSVIPSMALAALPRVQYAILPWFAVGVEAILTRGERIPFKAGTLTFDATVLAIGLDACVGGETAERMSFYACLGGRGGGFSTQGYGVSSSDLVTRPWWALAASSQARAWILPSFGIGIGIEALFALAQRDLVARSDQPGGAPQSQSVPPFGLAVSGGPVFRFF